MTLPQCETLKLAYDNGVLHAGINRPEARNAMSEAVVKELTEIAKYANAHPEIRIVVLRGEGGNFCAGGDIKDMANVRSAPDLESVAKYNRGFGDLLTAFNEVRAAVVVVLEGAVLGGGFGLACISDVAIAHTDAKFGLPETGLGLPPAQIAPFVVARIGITQARRLGVCGTRFNGEEALRLGLVHFVEKDEAGLNARLEEVLKQIRRCAPNANAATKRIMLRVGQADLETLLDDAAMDFARAIHSDEGEEGPRAFIQKRLPSWAE